MERNWLIRTSQDQILGPVAKAKVVEFLDKGALGLNDEVCSGNGYWFYIKEKDLVDKYIYGDIPQNYNPISEAKTVIAHHHRNPDATASLSSFSTDQTQVIKLQSIKPDVALPNQDDLEFPDLKLLNSKNIGGEASGEYKIPANDDLEFPDVDLIKKSVDNDPLVPQINKAKIAEEHIEFKVKPQEQVKKSIIEVATAEVVAYPVDDDLAFPDLVSTKETKSEVATKPMIEVEKKEPSISKLEVHQHKLEKFAEKHEDKKLLHERKIKTSAQSKNISNAKNDKKDSTRSMPEELKKRNDNYLLYILIILVLIFMTLFFYYYRTILNKPLPV